MILTIIFLYAGIGAITAVFRKNDLFKSTWAGFWIATFSLTIYPFIAVADALALKVPFLEPDRLVSMQTRPIRLFVILAIVTFYWAALFMGKSTAANKPSKELSDRELDVFYLLTQGKSNKAISDELNIALPTVKSHVSNILRKRQVKNRSELIGINRETQ